MNITKKFGDWTTYTDLDDVLSYRQVITHILNVTPAEVLDSPVALTSDKVKSGIMLYRKDPAPTYDDPLAQNGFVAFKIYYEGEDDTPLT